MKSCFVVGVSCQGSSLPSHLILVFMAMSHCWTHIEVNAEELLHTSTIAYLIGVLQIELDLEVSRSHCPRQTSVIRPLLGKCSLHEPEATRRVSCTSQPEGIIHHRIIEWVEKEPQ